MANWVKEYIKYNGLDKQPEPPKGFTCQICGSELSEDGYCPKCDNC